MSKWTKESIVKLLETNDKAIARALIVLKNRQTAEEQSSEMTVVHNGRGFQPFHAKIGTSMANFYEKYGYLSDKQVAFWRKPNSRGAIRIGVYWRQLIEEAEIKAANDTSFNYGALAQ